MHENIKKLIEYSEKGILSKEIVISAKSSPMAKFIAMIRKAKTEEARENLFC